MTFLDKQECQMDLQKLKGTKILIEDGTLILRNKNVEKKYAVKKLSKRLAAASVKELNDYTIFLPLVMVFTGIKLMRIFLLRHF